jgi:hypothetical protein
MAVCLVAALDALDETNPMAKDGYPQEYQPRRDYLLG